LEGSDCGMILRCYTSVNLEGLTETTKNLSQNSQSEGRDLNPGLPEYEAVQ
jgi:hypothetical protein